MFSRIPNTCRATRLQEGKVVLNGLTNTQQALLVVVGFVLTPIGVWMTIGFPMSHSALGVLGGSIIAGIILAIKEYIGVPIPVMMK